MNISTNNQEQVMYALKCNHATESDIAEGIVLLESEGYSQLESNPHNVRAWFIGNEYGRLGIVTGANIQEAIDNAVDNDLMDSELMSDADYQEYSENGWGDSYILAGNASEPFWSEHLWAYCAATTRELMSLEQAKDIMRAIQH